MRSIKFKGCNCTYAENQSQYLPLPAHKTKDGTLTCCWKLRLRERIRVLFVGRVFLQILTFNAPLQPLRMSVTNLIEGEN